MSLTLRDNDHSCQTLRTKSSELLRGQSAWRLPVLYRFERGFERGSEFKCVFGVASRVGSSMDSSVYSSVSTRRARMLCQSSGKSFESRQPHSERMQVQMAHTSVALDKTNVSADSAVFHTPRAIAMNAAKLKQFELWQLDECDIRIKGWEAREM